MTENIMNKEINNSLNLDIVVPSVYDLYKQGSTVVKEKIRNITHSVSHGTIDLIFEENSRVFLYGWMEKLLPEDKQQFVQEAYTTLTTNLSPIHESIDQKLDKYHSGASVTFGDIIEDVNNLKKNDEATNELVASIIGLLETDYGQYMQGSSSGADFIRAAFSGLVGFATDAFGGLPGRRDGVSETSFGMLMENSWYISGKSFLNTFKNKSSGVRIINVMDSTPLDPGEARENLYGSMMLGCPFIYNSNTDPYNRNLSNTILKNSRFLSLTPGFPKYNGTSYSQGVDNVLNQTQTGEQMLKYLKKNHLDSEFSDKDKRYYSFKTDYATYFSYLETMLNPIWIKLGLSKGTNDQTFNIFSFFKIKSDDGNIDPTKTGELIEKYQSSIGFYVNPSSGISESIDSSTSDFNMGSEANDRAQEFQKIHYFTGLDSNSWRKRLSIGSTYVEYMRDFLSNTFVTSRGLSAKWGGNKAVSLRNITLGTAGALAGAAIDITRAGIGNDLGVLLQSYAVSNGMILQYPRMWMSSSYTKSMNFNLSFVSPYGDPLSIFKYVYVPFCALLCFAMPRQASENGLVSPFLVRADIPGLITSDLAMITNVTWTKGGSENLWTKDGLPRAIDVSFTIEDLYPYLSMSKRMSFLSANPSYTVFLDNMAGLCALVDKSKDNHTDILNDYFDELINRVNSQDSKGLWNTSGQYKRESINSMYSSTNNTRRPLTGNLQKESINWLK